MLPWVCQPVIHQMMKSDLSLRWLTVLGDRDRDQSICFELRFQPASDLVAGGAVRADLTSRLGTGGLACETRL
jgi:hypothetical protein